VTFFLCFLLCFVDPIFRYRGIFTVPGLFLVSTDLRQPGVLTLHLVCQNRLLSFFFLIFVFSRLNPIFPNDRVEPAQPDCVSRLRIAPKVGTAHLRAPYGTLPARRQRRMYPQIRLSFSSCTEWGVWAFLYHINRVELIATCLCVKRTVHLPA